MKITAKQKSELEKARKKISQLVLEQESIYDNTKKILKTSDNGGYLSDYLFSFIELDKLQNNL